MFTRLFILSFLISTLASAEDLPWIGVSLGSAKAVDWSASDLPEGSGLKVSQIIEKGPYALAGGKVNDLWWKLDGQMLVHKAQILVLLRSKSVGDSVTIDYYRDGNLASVAFALGAGPRGQLTEISTGRSGGDDARVTLKREQIARLTLGDDDLTLKREREAWRFEVMRGPVTVLSALVEAKDLSQEVPAKWHDSFLMLRLTLDQQSSRPQKGKAHRIRYVPRSKASEESN